jgi:hypothetical protein
MNAASEVPFCGTARLKSQIGYFLPHEVERMGCFMTLYAADGLLRVGGAAVAQVWRKREKGEFSGQVEVASFLWGCCEASRRN